MSTADFRVVGSVSGAHPSTEIGAEVVNGEDLSFELEASPGLDVRKVQFTMVAKDAAATVSLVTTPASGIAAPTPLSAVTATAPAAGLFGYLMRCTVNDGVDAEGRPVAEWVRERVVYDRSLTLRKMVPGESTQCDATYGWVEAFNAMVDAISGGILIALATAATPGAIAPFGATAHTHMVSDGVTPGLVPTSVFAIEAPMGVFRPEDPAFGAVGDGVTDDGPAFQAAIDAAAAAGGGIVQAGAAVYLIGQTLDPGVTAPITIRGVGWRCTNMAAPGDATWVAGIGTTITGTVIKSTAANGWLVVAGNNGKGLRIEDLAVVGPGVGGAAIGVNICTGTYITQAIVRNVLLANFKTGLRLDHAYDHSFYDLNVYGCTTGVDIADDVTDTKFYALRLQACDVAFLAQSCARVDVYGGLVQGCKLGYNFAPSAAASVACCSVDGVWFEGPAYDAGTQVHFAFDSTNNPITNVAFRSCRTSTNCTVTPTIVSAISSFTFADCDFAGVTLVYDADMTRFDFQNSKFAEIQQSGGSQGFYSNVVQATPNASLTSQNRHLNPVSVAFDTAAIAIDWREGDTRLFYLEHDAGGGDVDVAVGLPTNAPDFAELTLLFQQRNGLRKLTWAAGYNIAWQDSWTTTGFACVKLIHVGGGSWLPLVPFAGWAAGSGPLHTTGATYGASTAIDDGDSPYALAADVSLLRCDTSAGNPITVNLPNVNVSADRHLLVHDWGGTASIDPITIAAVGGQTINGVASIDITTDGGSAYIYCNGVEWKTIPTA
jgi:hypothetical protein